MKCINRDTNFQRGKAYHLNELLGGFFGELAVRIITSVKTTTKLSLEPPQQGSQYAPETAPLQSELSLPNKYTYH